MPQPRPQARAGTRPHHRRSGGPWLLLAAIATATAFTTGGCYRGTARSVTASDIDRDPGWIRVSGVQFIKQSSEKDCGAAALAMVLQRWGVPASMADIVSANPVQSGHGISAGALRDYARGKGLSAFLIKGEMGDLIVETKQNRPVLVGVVQRYASRAFAHYEVVVGINERTRRVLLLDPARDMREDSFEGFTTEWDAAGKLTLVVGAP